MPERLTQRELLAAIKRERAALDAAVARAGPARLEDSSLDGGRSVKDVLAHVCAWEKICMALVRNNRPLQPPPAGENGPSTDAINDRVYEESSAKSVAEVVDEARRSHEELLALVDGLSDAALDARVGEGQEGADASPPVGGLIRGNSDEHYREHAEQINRWLDGR